MGIAGVMNDTKSTVRPTASTDNDALDSIRTYLGDMLALEKHIASPLDRQVEMDDTKNYARAIGLVERIKSQTQTHVQALQKRLDALGDHPSNPVKSAWSGLLGAGAAAVDGVRKTKVSKNLRDDYTALSLASVSYSMLNATALGFGDSETAQLAQRHLSDYARLIMDLCTPFRAWCSKNFATTGGTSIRASRSKRSATSSRVGGVRRNVRV